MNKVLGVLWPSFLAACLGELAFFSLFDPLELHLLGEPIEASRTAVYSFGFFAFWLLAAVSSALTVSFNSKERAAEA